MFFSLVYWIFDDLLGNKESLFYIITHTYETCTHHLSTNVNKDFRHTGIWTNEFFFVFFQIFIFKFLC
jgi:hypothetical protein